MQEQDMKIGTKNKTNPEICRLNLLNMNFHHYRQVNTYIYNAYYSCKKPIQKHKVCNEILQSANIHMSFRIPPTHIQPDRESKVSQANTTNIENRLGLNRIKHKKNVF